MLQSPFRFSVCSIVAALMLTICSPASVTASDAARRAYGNGVHLFYQGRLFEAVDSFDVAAAELQDARIYYFRGLAKRRLGQAAGAEVDFRRAARLEAATGRQNVGRALERIQGGDRLVIERYRRNARRLAKSNSGQRAPRVGRAEPLPEPRAKPEVQELAVSELPTDLPPDDRDPFASSATGFLGRGTVEKAAHATPAAEPAADVAANRNDEPLGSGFDEDSLDDEPFPAEFANDSDFGSDADPGSPSSQQPEKRGALGSIFRAITKSAMPASPEQGKSLIQGIRGSLPLPGQPSGSPNPNGDPQFAEPPMDEQDPFAAPTDEPINDEPADDDPTSEPFADPGSDPFDDASDPFGTDDSADSGPDDAGDPFGDTEDPFADEGDPFADDQ